MWRDIRFTVEIVLATFMLCVAIWHTWNRYGIPAFFFGLSTAGFIFAAVLNRLNL